MSAKRISYLPKFGKPPGSVDYTGVHRQVPVRIDLIRYNSDGVEIIPLKSIEEFDTHYRSGDRHWLRIFGLHDSDVLRAVGTRFDISDLVLEDVANARHSPKRELYDDYGLFIMKLFYQNDKGELHTENVSYLLQKNVLISFSERAEGHYQPLQERIEKSRGQILKGDLDYLLFALIDLLADYTILLIDNLSEEIDALEVEAGRDRSGRIVESIIQKKREIIMMLRNFMPLQEMVNLSHEQFSLIQPDNERYFADLRGMIKANVGQLEFLRELLSDLVDIHSSLMDHRMNRAIYTLTLISAVFIPLTFIAGVYGMNFDHMPELHYPNAYRVTLGVMGVIAIGMLLYMKRKNWF